MPESHLTTETPTFEAALAELQQIVVDLENGRIGLEESLARFERGIRLLKTCHQVLEQAEQKIEMLIGMKSDGSPITEPFDATATADSESPTAGRRRSRKPKPEAVVETPVAEDRVVEESTADEDAGFLF